MTNERMARQNDEVFVQVRTILQEICPGAAVTSETDLVEDLEIDSLRMMNLILRAEEQFGLILGGREIEAGVLRTAGSLAQFLEIASSHVDVAVGDDTSR